MRHLVLTRCLANTAVFQSAVAQVNTCLLVIGWSCCQDIGLQLWEEPLLIFALTDFHIKQMWVNCSVIHFHQSLLN